MFRTLLLLIISMTTLSGQIKQSIDEPEDNKMEWFKDARLGIFIHWGIYAVNGIDESWSFYNGYISHEDYLKQTEGFTAKKYDPEEWVQLIKNSGARYAVITSRHHDGFALWKSKYGNFNVAQHSKARKDVLTPFVDALKKSKLKTGIYYSLSDWSHTDYTHFTSQEKRYTIEADLGRWNKYKKYFQGQLMEIAEKYDPDLYWFDGDWEHSAAEWEAPDVRKMLLDHNPNAILNSRLQGEGDYATPEQGMPILKPKDKYWELCLTMNDSWGYQQNDNNYKSISQVIGIFCDVISNGGNLLLDIGPKADGSIPEEQVAILKELGKWTGKHSEAIYMTDAGIPKEHFYGASTLSKDRKTLYLFVKGDPGGEVVLRGLKNKINRVWVVGEGTKLKHTVVGKVYWSEYPGIKYIQVPNYVLDDHMTVLAVLLDDEVSLYREE